jgi:hypothetical protein
VRFAHDAASLMMRPAGHWGKHRIMDREALRIISERSAEASSAATGGDIISIRLRRVILLRSDIRLTPGDITLRVDHIQPFGLIPYRSSSGFRSLALRQVISYSDRCQRRIRFFS